MIFQPQVFLMATLLAGTQMWIPCGVTIAVSSPMFFLRSDFGLALGIPVLPLGGCYWLTNPANNIDGGPDKYLAVLRKDPLGIKQVKDQISPGMSRLQAVNFL